MDTKSWSYDYEDSKEITPVFEYATKYYPYELKELKEGAIEYLKVWCY